MRTRPFMLKTGLIFVSLFVMALSGLTAAAQDGEQQNKAAATWNLTYVANPIAGGTITGPATIPVATGSVAAITVTAKDGFIIDTVTANKGATVTGTDPYTLGNVTADTTVTATFIPKPAIDSVDLISPLGNVVGSPDTQLIYVFLAATVTLTEDAPQGTAPQISFTLDGEIVAAALQEGVWGAIVPVPMNSTHTFSATAKIGGDNGTQVKATTPPSVEIKASEERTFVVDSADDLDSNALPDNPFQALPAPGDSWYGTHASNSCFRQTQVLSLAPSTLSPVAFMANPGNPSQLWAVRVPGGLIASGQQAMLVLAMACDEMTLYAPETAPASADRPAEIMPGGGFYEAHVLVSNDSGATFDEISPAQLGLRPLEMAWLGLKPSPGYTTSLWGRGASVEGDGTGGIRVVAGTANWDQGGIAVLESPDTTGQMTAKIARQGALAPFQTARPAELTIAPGGEAGRFAFGIIPAGRATTQVFTLANTGSAPLSGAAWLVDTSGGFFLKQPANYTIDPGKTAEITLQFTPTLLQDYAAVLTFTGGVTGPQSVQVSGTGTTPAKSPIGCGTGDSQPWSWTDCVAAGAAMAVLLAASLRPAQIRE